MHFHLEMICPPSDDVINKISAVLNPYCEDFEDEDGDHNVHAFFDYFVISGRYSGQKLIAKCEQKEINEFYDWLKDKNVTVSDFVAGKQELFPSSQIQMVDAEWNKRFPSGKPIACPLFKHSGEFMERDICAVKDIPKNLAAYQLVVVNEDFSKLQYRLLEEYWNGCNFQKTDWDGNVLAGLGLFNERHQDNPIPEDWLCVTIDYHS